MALIPFSEPSEPDEWVYTTAGRMSCEACGEWIYPRHPAAGGPTAFPPECQVCGAPTSDPSKRFPEDVPR